MMASPNVKSSSVCDQFQIQMTELKQMKIDLEQSRNELTMAQTKYYRQLSDYEAKLQQLHCQAEKVQAVHDENETNLQNATAEWRDIKSRLESSVVSANEKVKLNVGGRCFQTTIETLTKHSEEKTTYFKALFSRQWQLEKDSKEDSIFIDRDGDLFEYILQYLWTGRTPIDVDHAFLREDLIVEAQFYNLDTLFNLLNQNSSKKEPIARSPSSIQSNAFYVGTKILSSNDQLELNKLSEYGNQHWQLIYRASRDGYTAKAFHQYCDGCFPTMCVIRSTNGFVFGGFTSIPWSSTDKCRADTQAFLFTLKNPHAIKPTKYSVRERRVEAAISHNPNNGPTFGAAQYGGVDLSLRNPFNVEGNQTFFPQTYEDTTRKGRLTFTGKDYFACEDVEIFTLI